MNSIDYFLSTEQLLEVLSKTRYATAIYAGENLVVQLASDGMLKFWGKDKSVIGLPVDKTGSHSRELIQLLEEVWSTGISYQSRGKHVHIEGAERYLDIDYRPIKNADGEVYCILDILPDLRSGFSNAEQNRAGVVNEVVS